MQWFQSVAQIFAPAHDQRYKPTLQLDLESLQRVPAKALPIPFASSVVVALMFYAQMFKVPVLSTLETVVEPICNRPPSVPNASVCMKTAQLDSVACVKTSSSNRHWAKLECQLFWSIQADLEGWAKAGIKVEGGMKTWQN